MVRLRLLIAWLLIWSLAAWIQAQEEEDAPPTTARIRFSALAETMPSLDIFLDETPIISDLSYSATSAYIVVEEGIYALSFGDDNPVTELSLTAGKSYIAFLEESQGFIQANIVDETALAFDDTTNEVPFIIYNNAQMLININIDGQRRLSNLATASYDVVGISEGASIELLDDDETIVFMPSPIIPNIVGLIILTENSGRFSAHASLAAPMSLFDFILMNSQSATGLLFMSGFNILIPSDEPLTFFLPTDAAFAKLPTGVEAGGTGEAAFLLLHHTIQGDYTLQALGEIQSIPTLHGAELTLRSESENLIINDTVQIPQNQWGVQVENVRVYLIDDVLLPPQLRVEIVEIGTIEIGEAREGRFKAQQRHRYRLTVDDAVSLNILLSDEEGTLDTFLRVYDGETGELIAENDDFNGINAGIEALVAEQGKSLIIEATTYDDASEGAYRLIVEKHE